ncbi:MAG: hypothetical protein ACKVG9_11205, partial [Rhodospirillales bacterium]
LESRIFLTLRSRGHSPLTCAAVKTKKKEISHYPFLKAPSAKISQGFSLRRFLSKPRSFCCIALMN